MGPFSFCMAQLCDFPSLIVSPDLHKGLRYLKLPIATVARRACAQRVWESKYPRPFVVFFRHLSSFLVVGWNPMCYVVFPSQAWPVGRQNHFKIISLRTVALNNQVHGVLNEEPEEPSPEEPRKNGNKECYIKQQSIQFSHCGDILQSFQNHPAFQQISCMICMRIFFIFRYIEGLKVLQPDKGTAKSRWGQRKLGQERCGARSSQFEFYCWYAFFNESTRPNIPELGCTEANGTTHLTKNSNCDPLRCHTLGQQVFIVGQLLSIA